MAFFPVAVTNPLATVSIAHAILYLKWPHVLSTKERNPYKPVRNFKSFIVLQFCKEIKEASPFFFQ